MSDPGLFADLRPGQKRRFVQRLMLKLTWPVMRTQIDYNRAALEQLTRTQSRVDSLEIKMNTVISDLEHHSKTLTRHEAFALTGERLSTRIELAQEQAFARITQSAGATQRQMSDLAVDLEALKRALDDEHFEERRLEEQRLEEQRFDSSRVEIQNFVESRLVAYSRDIAEVRQRLGSIDVMLDGVRSTLPEPDVMLIRPDSRMDTIYGALEATFRGSSALVKERLGSYSEDFKDLPEGKRVLDVGCGRGELLEMLKDAGIPAYGIEVNATYAPEWEAAGLDVLVSDVARHLRTVQERSLAAITAIQVVEHLDVEALLEFLDIAMRALAPGGLLLLETPNPANLTVGANSFYLDPSHERPLPAELLSFLVRSRGFADVEVRYFEREELATLPELDPKSEWAADFEAIQDVLRRYLFGPQDYAVVARRT
ncbi:MAG TPA: methyltransferase domain-containing protein [Acidimicrobiales bacterium]